MDLHDEFIDAIKLLRSSKEMDYELGFEYLGHQGLANEFQEEFLQLYQRETDPFIRGRFVEILGYMDRPDIFDFIKEELNHPHKEVKYWAECVLSILAYQKRLPEAIELMKEIDLYVEEN